jgi:predicted nucleic acid-binding protein
MYDTSVLVPALVVRHPAHAEAHRCFAAARAGAHAMLVNAHSLAECYSVLTGLPVRPRIAPASAQQLIEKSILAHASTVELSADDYADVIEELARLGLSGGIVYDGLLVRAARKSRASVILTLNPDDFLRLEPPGSIEVVTPDKL